MADWQPQSDPGAMAEHQHEFVDVSLTGIAGMAAGLFVAILVALIGLWGFFKLLSGNPASYEVIGAREGSVRIEPPVFDPAQVRWPVLEVNPTQTLREVREPARQQLRSYGWVDRETGIVRIPIQRAIEQKAADARAAGEKGTRENEPTPQTP